MYIVTDYGKIEENLQNRYTQKLKLLGGILKDSESEM